MYHVKKMVTWPIQLTLNQPFTTAHGITTIRPLTLVQVTVYDDTTAQTAIGYGEIQSFADYHYALETQQTSQDIVDTLIKPVIGTWQFTSPSDFAAQLARVTPFGSFAKAGVEMAVWDAVGKLTQQSLQQMLGGVKLEVPVGIALGMPVTDQAIRTAIQQGYRRIKLKIDGRQTDLPALMNVLARYPEQQFSLDANSSFNPETAMQLKALPANVLFVEQPFGEHDFTQHAALQRQMKQPLSLDESVNNLADVATNIALHAASAVTIKQGKIGGITAAVTAIKLLHQAGFQPWIGGMLSSNLGRGVDLALASLPEISIPGDISASSRYFTSDITTADLQVRQGLMTVPTAPGIGLTLKDSQIMV